MVHTGNRFDVPIEVSDLMCPAIDKRFKYKFRRVPLGDREDDDEEIVGDIPVDTYYIGLHLGDGTAGTSCIVSSEAPVRDYIYSYVDRINQTSPFHHEVIATLTDPAGAVLPDGYVAHVATWQYKIVVRGRRLVNVVKEGMRNLGIYTCKEGGIPREVMEGTTEQKLQYLAGLIDSDGTLRIDNSYVLTQLREEHRAITYSAKALAESVGICVTALLQTQHEWTCHGSLHDQYDRRRREAGSIYSR